VNPVPACKKTRHRRSPGLSHLLAERRAGAVVQQALLPERFPTLTGFSVSLYLRPLAELSGDFYDMICLDDETVCFYVADVSGHGIGPALITVFLRQTLAELAANGRYETLRSPNRTLATLWQRLAATCLEQHFVTMVYGVLNSARRELVFASAGHPLPLVAHGRKLVQFGDIHGPLLSPHIEPIDGWPEQLVSLPAGSRAVFYTDGLIDARNADGMAFGADALGRKLLEGRLMSGEQWMVQTIRDLEDHVEPHGPSDDIALMVITADETEQPVETRCRSPPDGPFDGSG
jgi:phosphoserine phosphatase RsbU/P